jgi:hypothetical protein
MESKVRKGKGESEKGKETQRNRERIEKGGDRKRKGENKKGREKVRKVGRREGEVKNVEN